jgi:transmembrane sensor
MPKLRAPLRALMDDSLDAARVQRMWRGIERGPVRARRGAWVLAGALALSVVLALVFRSAAPGPLAAVGGGAPAFERGRVVLSDGSQIGLSDGADVGLVENSGQAFVLQLRRGRAHFDVTPGGPRRWRIECGLASVSVVGTRFVITRRERALRVEVEHGVVEVRGAGVAGGVQRLLAGQALSVGEAAGAGRVEHVDAGADAEVPLRAAASQVAERPPVAATPADVAVPAAASVPPLGARTTVMPPLAARERAREGLPLAAAAQSAGARGSAQSVGTRGAAAQSVGTRGAAAQSVGARGSAQSVGTRGAAAQSVGTRGAAAQSAGARGSAARSAGARVAGAGGVVVDRGGSQLLEQADRARRDGAEAHARSLLMQLLREQPGTAEAAIGAFSLARMQMQAEPDAAVAALKVALEAPAPASLREDALARLVEAYARAGKRELAARAADDYRLQYPDGRRLAEVERWAAPR